MTILNKLIYVLGFLLAIVGGYVSAVDFKLLIIPFLTILTCFLVYKKGINFVITTLLIITAFLIRPSALGQQLTIAGAFFAMIAFIVFAMKAKGKVYLKRQNSSLIIASLIFWSYCGIQSLLLNSMQMEFVLKSITIDMLIVVVFSIILNDETINYNFFRSFIIILSILAFSYCITFVLSFFISIDSLQIGKINVSGYDSIGNIYFPFTIAYNLTNINSFIAIRMSGLFREVGITQLFYIYSLFICDTYFKRTKIIKLFLFIGVLTTLSTAGFINLIVAFALFIITKKENKFKNMVIGLVIIIAIGLTLLNAPGLSMQDKAVDSITDRQYATMYGIQAFADNPIFGVGYYNNSTAIKNSGINFVSSAYTIGIVGCVLYSLIFISTCINSLDKRKYIVCIAPLIITLLFSQPLIDSPLIYVLLLGGFNVALMPKKIANETA